MKKICVSLGIWAVLSGTALFSQQEKFRKSAPPSEPLQELKLPPIESAPLSNKLNISFVLRDNVPFMSLEIVIFAGEALSPDKIPGTATFVASMLGRGTQSRTAADIEGIVESIGGTFSVSTNQDYVLVSFHFFPEYLDQALDLISQMLLQPNFTKSEIDYVKFATTYDLLGRERNLEFVANRHLFRLLFKNHPYEKFAFSSDVIKNWNLNALLDFFDRYYRPNNAHLIITGNLNLNTVTRKVSHYLNTWQPRELPPMPLQTVKPPDKDRLCLIDVPQAKDCVIYFGTAFPSPGTQDRFALMVLNQILGGTPTSRLFMNLRESKAFAYNALSEIDFFNAGGAFCIQARVTPEFIAPSIREIQKEIKALTTSPISSQEIEQAKSYLIYHFPVEIERLDAFSEKVADIKARSGGDECWNKYYEQVMLVNGERVFGAAQKYLLQPFIVVVAGDKSVLSERLSEFDSFDVFDSKGQFQYTANKDKKGAAHEAR
jgi:predicted Zn-dependent peptidase